ncbi:MAG: T9SS type A sorting domain-containing protein [Saprospiraceae bacterium]|nr:T9SS type A sorting domain-containing protein [Saprospiraceae bacterium]
MRFLFLLLLSSLPFWGNTQKLFPVQALSNETLPQWALDMYAPNPNVYLVEDGYRIWRKSHPEEKTTFTQYYKKWRRALQPYIQANGFVKWPTEAEKQSFYQRLSQINTPPAGFNPANWVNLGPIETFNTNTGPDPLAKSEQANIYCIDQSLSNPDVLYCGTEGGEIFKSNNRGQSWFCVSRNYEVSAPTALEVHPTDPNIVFAGEGAHILKSTDGGVSWNQVLDVWDLGVNEILINQANTQIVLAATFKGLYRSEDAGENWTQLFPEASYDIEWKTDDPTVAFLLRNDPAAKICRFYKSSDSGTTWNLKDAGWFFSDETGVNDGGARLAVTNADPNRVYAVLIGEAREGDAGFIGIYRSNDAGESWSLPNPPAGGPWNDTDHPNMATIGRTGGYHQGFYNLGFDASDSNPDFLLAGFLNLWYSTDGAASFTCFGGYCGNSFNYVHPDCQEIEINGDDIWMTSDGGIEHSTDHFQTHYALNRGITSSDFWGFGTGWNDDVLVGGRYHNGNTAWYEDWLPGESLGLGGGEAPTGYVNPGPGRKTYYSDLGGVVIPEIQNGYAEYFSFGKFPNESYYDAESGEIEWDPRCWNHMFVSRDNVLWKTTDGGSNWEILHEFGSDVNARTMGFEISRSNPQVIYLFQRAAYSWDPGKLWKTTDGGQTWNELGLPPGYARRVILTLSPEDENLLWIAYADGDNGQKVYQTVDGGASWINLTTADLDGEHITYLMHQGGTNGALYAGTYRTVWFKDENSATWAPFKDGLPKGIATCILRPFYRDGKLRMGAYGKGIWETPFAVASKPVAQPMVNKRETACPGDTLQFDDYSMLLHAGASWFWEFPGGQPATSTLRNPRVVYNASGEYDVKLTVTNGADSSSKTVEKMIRVQDLISNNLPVVNDFSNGLQNLTIVNPDNGITWEPIVLYTCEPNGDTVYSVNNYIYSGYGIDDILFPINLDLTQVDQPQLKFNVAYAPYYDVNPFIDSMKVMVSADCGNSFKTIFRSGGEALSTTTSGLGPNNLYEYEVFTPANCEEWREIVLDLSDYEGKYITLKIVNQSGYGNNMYVDDINLSGTFVSGVDDPLQAVTFYVSPNPTANDAVLYGASNKSQSFDIRLFNVLGKQVWQSYEATTTGNWQISVPMANLPTGMYWLSASNGTEVHTLKLTKAR